MSIGSLCLFYDKLPGCRRVYIAVADASVQQLQYRMLRGQGTRGGLGLGLTTKDDCSWGLGLRPRELGRQDAYIGMFLVQSVQPATNRDQDSANLRCFYKTERETTQERL